MQTDSLRLSAVVPASPQRVYDAWLDEKTHAAFTNLPATIDPEIGGRFTAGDGYISGETLWLERGRLIVQSWRASDFPEEAIDSRLEVHFEPVEGGTRVVIEHRDLPAGQASRYEEGWRTWYLEPLRAWFEDHPEAEASEPAAPERDVDEEAEVAADLLASDVRAFEEEGFSTGAALASDAVAAALGDFDEDDEEEDDREASAGAANERAAVEAEAAEMPRSKVAPRQTAARVGRRKAGAAARTGDGGAGSAGRGRRKASRATGTGTTRRKVASGGAAASRTARTPISPLSATRTYSSSPALTVVAG